MILRRFCWSIFLCLTLLQTTKAQVQIDGQGYQNVLISFAPNVASKDGKELVQSIQDLLESTSSVLHTAVGLRIASVTFLLPPSWSAETLGDVTVTPVSSEQAARKPDISVDAAENSPFGKQPVALQHGGCGVAGHQIILPQGFALRNSSTEEYPKGKLLAREWLKYRYGVFDENGFSGDPLYPDYYRIPGSSEIRITECTNSKLTYIFKKPLVDEACDMASEANFGYCKTHPEPADNITSSLMYFHEDLPNMEHICGKDNPHHDTSRNKQNALCNGQSIWDVVMQSNDFKTAQYQSEDPDSETIQFSYIQESKPRFVVVLENSDNLHDQREPIRFALRRFYYDLPPKSKFAIYTYNSDVSDALPYTELPDQERGDLGIIADFGTPAATNICPSCGLAKAAQELISNGEAEKGSILLITASPLDKVPELPENLKESGICLRVLRFTDESVDPTYNDVENSFACFSQEPLQISLDVVDIFHALSRFLKNDVVEFRHNFEIKTVASGNMSAQNPITIPRDATSEMYTLWLNRVLGSGSIECNAGDAIVELNSGITATDTVSFTFPPMDNDVTCKLNSAKQSPTLTQVQMTTQKGHYFDFDAWIHDTSTENEQLPIIIYAKIYFGGYPVKYASVTTVVTSGDRQETVNMLDNGRGDPDVTQYDGIYSGYFTSFLEAGDYQISVKMSNDEGRAKIGKENPPLSSVTCCGSQVVSGMDEGVPAFEKETQIVYEAKNKTPDDGYPPSRILDLQVQLSNHSKEVTLSWTAPGGGKAADYLIKLFQNRKSAISNFDTTGTYLNASSIVPGDTGKAEELVIRLEDREGDETYYVSMRSLNEFSKKSEISNVAEFFLPKSGDETTVTEASSTPGGIVDDESAKRAQARRRTIEIVVGVLAGIVVLCILVYIGVYFFVQRPKRKEEKARARKKTENGGPRNVSSPSGQIGLNSIPADVIVRHHNEVEKAKSLHKDPPIFKEENLDSMNSSPELPENTRRNNKAAQYTMVQKAPENAASNSNQQDPSKSPKRMTVV